MIIESVVRNMILANNYLRDFIEGRVYLNRLPKNFVLPAMVICRQGGIGGTETFYWDEARINIVAYAKEILELNAMYEKYIDNKWLGLNQLLHKKYNYIRKVKDTDVVINRSIRTAGPIVKFEPEILVYSMDLFYSFRYKLKGWDKK